MNSRFHLQDSGFFVSGTPIVSGIPDSLNPSDLFGIPKANVSRIPESICSYIGRSVVAFILLSLYYRNGTHQIPFPPNIWTSEMTQDLRAAYDADLELKLRCTAAGNRGIQVGAKFSKAGLRRNKLFYFRDVGRLRSLAYSFPKEQFCLHEPFQTFCWTFHRRSDRKENSLSFKLAKYKVKCSHSFRNSD